MIIIGGEHIECPLNRWGNREINIYLPIDLGRHIGRTDTNATAWVKLAGSELGPTGTIRLTPVIPHITRLSSSELTPGQELLIEGENFLNERGIGYYRGDVELEGVAGARFVSSHYTIVEWRDNAILIQLNDTYGGAMGQALTLSVKNASGQEDSTRVTFVPALEADSIWGNGWSIHNIELSDIAGFFRSFGGDRREATAFNGRTLLNGWTVVRGRLRVSGGGAGHGANILSGPAIGTNNPRFRLEYWADGFAWVSVSAYCDIQGPRGIDWH